MKYIFKVKGAVNLQSGGIIKYSVGVRFLFCCVSSRKYTENVDKTKRFALVRVRLKIYVWVYIFFNRRDSPFKGKGCLRLLPLKISVRHKVRVSLYLD